MGHGKIGVLGGDFYVVGAKAGVMGTSLNNAGGYFDRQNGTILVGSSGFWKRFRVDNAGKVFANGDF